MGRKQCQVARRKHPLEIRTECAHRTAARQRICAGIRPTAVTTSVLLDKPDILDSYAAMDAGEMEECAAPDIRNTNRRLKLLGWVGLSLALFAVGCLGAGIRYYVHEVARTDARWHTGNEVREVHSQLSWTHGYWIMFAGQERTTNGDTIPCYLYWYAIPWRKVLKTH